MPTLRHLSLSALLCLTTACSTSAKKTDGLVNMVLDPASVTSPVYPPDIPRPAAGGSIGLSLYCQTDGHISDAKVIQSSGNERLDAVALAESAKWRCQPAADDPTARRVPTWATAYSTFRPAEPARAAPIDLPVPDYPAESIRQEESGSVRLALSCDTEGKVSEVRLQETSGFPRLDKAAQDQAAHWQCGQSAFLQAGTWHIVTFSFTLTLNGGPKVWLHRLGEPSFPKEQALMDYKLIQVPADPGPVNDPPDVGLVHTLFRCEADGHVSDVRVSVSSGMEKLDQRVLAGVRATPCTPGKNGRTGKPIRSWGTMSQVASPSPLRPEINVETLKLVLPEYPTPAVRAQEEGSVTMLYQCDPDSKVTILKIAQSSGFPLLDMAALAAFQSPALRCKPALGADGKASRAWGSLKYTFRLNNAVN